MCEKRSFSISLHVFSPWQSPNKFGFAHLAYRKRSYSFSSRKRNARNFDRAFGFWYFLPVKKYISRGPVRPARLLEFYVGSV